MQLSEILNAIVPCDMEQPYIFISYSSKDHERVWQDVLRFQQMGYNVWLDEKNLDKTQESWRTDALAAIRDLNCSLLVFYVSRHSLISQPCFSELSCTVEDYTKAVHFGPVKFIAVDAEPIDDIVQFSREVYTEIRSKDIPKSEKTEQAITLNNCIVQFFNSNNEKVRVKPFDMPNRKMDYYSEVTASFPEDTRVLPIRICEETPAPVEAPAPAEAPVPVDVYSKATKSNISGRVCKYNALWKPEKLQKLEELAKKAISKGEQVYKSTRSPFDVRKFIYIADATSKQRKALLTQFPLGKNLNDVLWFLGDDQEISMVLTKTELHCRRGITIVYLPELARVEQTASGILLLTYNGSRQEDLLFCDDPSVIKAILDVYMDYRNE